jgi:quercetin dioxygenase-like cupin family protein
MTNEQSRRTRPPGETTGSPQRPAQRVAGAVLFYDLAKEIAGLHQEVAWQQGDRNARTLVREGELRVVLTVLKQGGRLDRHQAPGRLTIHTIQGHLRLQLPSGPLEVMAGQMVALEPDLPHDVEAIEESAFLITIAWPRGDQSA